MFLKRSLVKIHCKTTQIFLTEGQKHTCRRCGSLSQRDATLSGQRNTHSRWAENSLLIFIIMDAHGRRMLCYGWYRPLAQWTILLNFMINNLGRLLTEHRCEIIIIGDMNQHIIQTSCDALFAALDIRNHFDSVAIVPSTISWGLQTIRQFYQGLISRSRDEQNIRILWKREQDDWVRLNQTLK